MNIEERLYRTTLTLEERATDAGGKAVFFEGQGIVFNQPSRPLYDERKGAFIEYIEPGAIDENTDTSEVLAVFNHDENRLLGANYSGTLRFVTTDTAVSVTIRKPENSVGNDCAEWVRRGDIRAMSFKFVVGSDRWEVKDNVTYRYVEKIARLLDLSLVTRAAYQQTTIDMAARAYRPAPVPTAPPTAVEARSETRAPTMLSPTDSAFLAGLISQYQQQITAIAGAIATLTDNRVKQLAASRLSDLIYGESWLAEMLAEMSEPPAPETPETELAGAETNAPTPDTNAEIRQPDSESPAASTGWYRAKNNIHFKTLLPCR